MDSLMGSIPAPSMFVENSKQVSSTYSIWKHQDQALMSLLISSLFEGIIAHVLEATASSEVWNILDEMFTTISQAHTMQIHYQLATLNKGSDTIAVYYQHAKILRDTLATSRKTLPSTEFITFILARLGIDYESVHNLW